jgi:hypothetical protein
MAFRSQQLAVTQVLQSIGWNRRALKGRVVDLSNTMTGLATRVRVYGEDDKLVEFDVQIDLI